MKSDNTFYYMCLVVIGLNFLMYCGGSNTGKDKEVYAPDSTDLTHEDTMSANLRDPASAFPLPPVTGTQIDSSAVKDSSGKQ